MPIVICPHCSLRCLVITEENSTRQHSCPGCGGSLSDAASPAELSPGDDNLAAEEEARAEPR